MRYKLVDLCKVDTLTIREANSYKFFKDDMDKDPVTITADDDDDADEKIKKITGKDPKKITKWSEKNTNEAQSIVDEDMTTSDIDGGSGQPMTPNAFSKKVKRPDDKIYTEINNINDTDVVISKKNATVTVEFITPRAKDIALGQFYNKYPHTTSVGGSYSYKINGSTVPKLLEFLRRSDLTYDVSESIIKSGDQLMEASYREWSRDTNSSPKEKINKAIHEVSKNLYMIERTISRSSKLKTEVGADQGVFWKSTQGKFAKINERLLRLSHKILELNK